MQMAGESRAFYEVIPAGGRAPTKMPATWRPWFASCHAPLEKELELTTGASKPRTGLQSPGGCLPLGPTTPKGPS